MSRIKNSFKNLMYGIVGQIISLTIGFIAKAFFIKKLGSDYLGLNSLFTNIMILLTLLEFGFGQSIIFGWYKSLGTKDEIKTKKLMNFHKKIYIQVAFLIFIIGLSIIPFLPFLIKSNINIHKIQFIYILFLINIDISYYFRYKVNYLITNQKEYIYTKYHQFFYILINIIQIIYIIKFEDYIGFLLIEILFNLIENIILSKKLNKMYPILIEEPVEIDKNTKSEIIKNAKAITMYKIGDVIINSSDSILLSSMVGLDVTGIYSNYYLIINSLNTIYSQLFLSLSASVGNLCASESIEKQYTIFKNINFLNFWIYCFSSICLFCLLNPFIELWLGNEYIFSLNIVLILVIVFYLLGMRKSITIFLESMGLFRYHQYKRIIEAVMNIILSIIFTYKFGTIGVFLGTFISCILCFWMEPYILYKYGFKKNIISYITTFIKQIGITIFLTFLFYQFINLFDNTVLLFIMKTIICVLLSNLCLFLFFYKDARFQYFYSNIKYLLKKV